MPTRGMGYELGLSVYFSVSEMAKKREDFHVGVLEAWFDTKT